jgi:DNA-binding MarR family transcriptional regulator
MTSKSAMPSLPCPAAGPPEAPVVDAETPAAESLAEDRRALRLWLRLLTCSTLIEGSVRRRLREEFGETLPRFDLLAQLDKAAEGLTLSELSRRMMVSNGNLTALVERLVGVGWVDRQTSAADRRAQLVRLSESGRAAFARMASRHEGWIAGLTAGLSPAEVEQLLHLLARLKTSAREAIAGPSPLLEENPV